MPHVPVSARNRRASEAQARIAAMLKAADQLFRTKGYEATSLREVLERSGGSKATLRKYFGDKPGLFSAVVARVTGQFVDDAHLRDAQGTPAEVLTKIGRSVLSFYMRQDALQAYRGVVGSGYRDGLAALLEKRYAGRDEPIVFLLHCACPRVRYMDRGKSAVVVD